MPRIEVEPNFRIMVQELQKLDAQADLWLGEAEAPKKKRARKKQLFILINDCDCDCIEKCEYDGEEAIKCFHNRKE